MWSRSCSNVGVLPWSGGENVATQPTCMWALGLSISRNDASSADRRAVADMGLSSPSVSELTGVPLTPVPNREIRDGAFSPGEVFVIGPLRLRLLEAEGLDAAAVLIDVAGVHAVGERLDDPEQRGVRAHERRGVRRVVDRHLSELGDLGERG